MPSRRKSKPASEAVPEFESHPLEEPPAATSEPFDAEAEGVTGTELAPAPSAAAPEPEPEPAPEPEPTTSFGSTFQSPPPPAYTPAEHVAPNMLPGRERRTSGLERLVVRVIATGGVVGIGVAIAAILAASSVQGWVIGLVVAIVSVILSAVLWSSRQL